MEKDNTVKQAGGFIVQVMPFIQEEVLAKLEENIAKIDSVTAMLDKGFTPEQILETVLEGMDVEYTDKLPANFHCNCSKSRVEKAGFGTRAGAVEAALYLASISTQINNPAYPTYSYLN